MSGDALSVANATEMIYIHADINTSTAPFVMQIYSDAFNETIIRRDILPDANIRDETTNRAI